MQRWIVMALVGLILLLSVSVSSAQENALRDGGFEGTYTQRNGRADFNIPADWNVWVATSPRTESWMNLEPVAFPHNGPGPSPQSGSRAMNFNKGFATFTVALYQQATVTPNSNLIATAFAQIKTCNVAPNADNCGSAVESGAYTRIGIDPTGGTDPNSPSIVWSTNAQPHDRWDQMTVNATAQGGTVTVFLYSTQRWPSQLNNTYFDSATLTGGGPGGSAPAVPGATAAPPPTPVPQTVPFVVAQAAADDGSVRHTVQAGDTIDSIAVAYGLTRLEIMELNNIRDPRIIQIGQELLIRAETSDAAEREPDAEPTETEVEATEEAAEPVEVAAVDTPVGEPTAAEPAAETEATDAPPTVEPTAAPLDVSSLPTAPVRSASSGDVLPASDPASQTGQVCALLFNDLNQNRIQESGEDTLAGGSLILVQGSNAVAEYTTDGTEPYCFTELGAGDYVASLAPPQGYGLTTPDQLRLRVSAGSDVNVAFGAAEGVQAPQIPADSGAPVEEAPVEVAAPAGNPITDNLGLIVLGAGALAAVIGLGVTFALRRR
jgi:LysM repeat protein